MSCCAAAHPRVCGENYDMNILSFNGTGSSPRVRGKLRFDVCRPRNWRLIPACAGKTQCATPNRYVEWAHPRVCGENHHTIADSAGNSGSSPRVRGKQCSRILSVSQPRLIPACAGKTHAGEQ